MSGSAWNPSGGVILIDAESTNISQPITVAANQVLLTLTAFNYVPETGAIALYRAGQKLIKGLDYLETDSTHVTLLITDSIEGEVYEVVGVIGSTGSNATLAQQAAQQAILSAAAAAQSAASAAGVWMADGGGNYLLSDKIIVGSDYTFKADFSNVDQTLRFRFQTKTANSATNVGAKPSGTGTVARYEVRNSSSDTNFAAGAVQVSGSEVSVSSEVGGTGTLLPIAFRVGANLALKIDTNLRVQVATASYNTPTIDNDLSFDLLAKNNFACTPTAGGQLAFTNLQAGQSGFVVFTNTAAYAITKASYVKCDSGFLSKLSATGVYVFSYYCDGTNVYVSTTGALS